MGWNWQGRGDVEKRRETYKSTAKVDLSTGNTTIFSDISKDGEQHVHLDLLKDHIPETLPTTWLFASIRTAICHSFGSTRTGSGTTLHRKVGLD